MTDTVFAARVVTSWHQHPDTSIDDVMRERLDAAVGQASITVKKRFAQRANIPVRRKYYTCEKGVWEGKRRSPVGATGTTGVGDSSALG